MRFEQAIRRAADAVKVSARGAYRPVIADVRRMKRRRRGLTAALFGFAATIAVIGGGAVLLGAPVEPRSTEAATSIGQSVGPAITTTPGGGPSPASHGWSIAYPPVWFRADSELMPDGERDSLTLATFPLRPGGTKCDLFPENALLDIGLNDSLVSILLSSSPPRNAPPWPAQGFSDTAFTQSSVSADALECSGRPDLQLFLGEWLLGDRILEVVAVFGAEAPSEVRAQTWEILSSLRAGRQTVAPDVPVCIATRPPLPGFLPPGPNPQTPADDTFTLFGTAELWTQLPIDGRHVPTKGAWWSDDFGGGTIEEEPDIVVTWRRVDAEAPLITSTARGGNAYTAEDGWFMLQGIWPEPSGCWSITATYRSTSLSYVTEVP